MYEKNNEGHYLSLKELISESLLRDLILFTFLFVLIIIQQWDYIFLLLFPLITFASSIFFRILSTNKKRTEFKNSLILYNPLGLERIHANRLFFCTIFQLILLYWLGAESLYNPHIVNWYISFFLGVLIFIYTFSFFWIFIDLWKYSKIEIIKKNIEGNLPQHIKSQFSSDLRNLISFLNSRNFRLISIISFLVFIILNIFNLILLFFMSFNSIGIQLMLPGYQSITLSYIFYGFLVISPSLTIILLINNYKFINKISREKLNKIIESFPRNIQIKIIENLKALNNKIKEQLKSE